MLTLLRNRGATGVTNFELNEVCLRYGARLFELRRGGFVIETRRASETEFRFVLTSEPESAPPPSNDYSGDFLTLKFAQTRQRERDTLPLFGEL